MKKLLSLVALVGIMASCNNKKEEKKTDEKKTDTTVTTTDDKMNSTTAAAGVPTFSDPEVQQFANDYAAFIAAYKAGINDPAKAAELSKSWQDWGTRTSSIGMKFANNPEDAKKWADWIQELHKDIMPVNK